MDRESGKKGRKKLRTRTDKGWLSIESSQSFRRLYSESSILFPTTQFELRSRSGEEKERKDNLEKMDESWGREWEVINRKRRKRKIVLEHKHTNIGREVKDWEWKGSVSISVSICVSASLAIHLPVMDRRKGEKLRNWWSQKCRQWLFRDSSITFLPFFHSSVVCVCGWKIEDRKADKGCGIHTNFAPFPMAGSGDVDGERGREMATYHGDDQNGDHVLEHHCDDRVNGSTMFYGPLFDTILDWIYPFKVWGSEDKELKGRECWRKRKWKKEKGINHD